MAQQFTSVARSFRAAGLAIGLVLVVAALCGVGLYSRADDAAKTADKPKSERFFELRTYVTHEGKMNDLHKRFREHTNRLFEKHGMTLVGFWTPADGPDAANTLVYMLAYPSREAREKSWKDFMDDPEWKAAYKESHKNGPLVAKVTSRYLKPTDYSPIK
jgi:NIPSNAP